MTNRQQLGADLGWSEKNTYILNSYAAFILDADLGTVSCPTSLNQTKEIAWWSKGSVNASLEFGHGDTWSPMRQAFCWSTDLFLHYPLLLFHSISSSHQYSPSMVKWPPSMEESCWVTWEIFRVSLLIWNSWVNQRTMMVTHTTFEMNYSNNVCCLNKILFLVNSHQEISNLILLLTLGRWERLGGWIWIPTSGARSLQGLRLHFCLTIAIALGWVLPLISEPAGRKEAADYRLLLQHSPFSLATTQSFPESWTTQLRGCWTKLPLKIRGESLYVPKTRPWVTRHMAGGQQWVGSEVGGGPSPCRGVALQVPIPHRNHPRSWNLMSS